MMLLCMMIMIPLMTMTAAAKTNEVIDLSEILIPIPEIVIVEKDPVIIREPTPLTPGGNLSLVDDINTDNTVDKQFITVVSKNGNYFYIVIDRDGNAENVYFLNLVDEADLLALIEDDEKPAPKEPEPIPTIPTEPPEARQEANTKKDSNMIPIIIFALLIIGGAGVYFKILKPKATSNKGGIDPNEFNFDPDDEPDNVDNIETQDIYEQPAPTPPVYQAPVYEAPVYHEPIYEVPIHSEPVYEQTDDAAVIYEEPYEDEENEAT